MNHPDEESQSTGLITPSEDDMLLPKAIETTNNGAKFVRINNAWHVDEEEVSARKHFSVYLSLETSFPTSKIIKAFDNAGVK